jgi:surface protein
MFGSCRVFNQPLNDWNVSNVKDMSSMFEYCRVFNQPLNDWNVSNVKNTSKMFVNCDRFDQSLSKWFFDPRLLRNVENMDDMFRHAPLLLKRIRRGYDQQNIAAQMRKAAQIPIDDEKEQPFPKCVICNDYLNNNDGPGPSTKCRNNCNDVINVCENNHLFHRGCILNSCNADRVDISSQMGFNEVQNLQTQSISTTCPICREKILPDCQGLRNKERVPTENINTDGLINKGGKRNRQFKRKTMKCKKSRKTKKSKKAKRSRKNTKYKIQNTK